MLALLVPLGLLALALPAPAAAQDARTLFFEGQEAYRVGNYDDAARLWNEAYALDPRPALLYNVAQAHERAGRLVPAMEALASYLGVAPPDAPERDAAAARLEQLRIRVASTAVVVRTDVEGARVIVDDEERGLTPLSAPLPVAPGERHIVVRLDGHSDFQLRVEVMAGTQLVIEPQFVPLRSTTPTGPAAEESSGEASFAPWLLVGGGAAIAIAGGITGALALDTIDGATFREDAEVDDARTLAIVSDALIGVGAAVAIGGLVWGIVELTGGAPSSRDQVRVTPQFGPTTALVTVEGRF